MRLPKSIRIFGKKFRINVQNNLKDDEGNQVLGLFDPSRSVIHLDKDQDRKEMMHTLIHELCHAVCWRVSIRQSNLSEELEELIVDTFATMAVETFDLRFKRKKGDS